MIGALVDAGDEAQIVSVHGCGSGLMFSGPDKTAFVLLEQIVMKSRLM
jgi:hypothetical protein